MNSITFISCQGLIIIHENCVGLCHLKQVYTNDMCFSCTIRPLSTTNMNEQTIYSRKKLYICILLLWNILFLVEQCEGQFQWGANYRLEAKKLKEMLSRKNNGNGWKTNSIVRK